jgi:hypothetical protein
MKSPTMIHHGSSVTMTAIPRARRTAGMAPDASGAEGSRIGSSPGLTTVSTIGFANGRNSGGIVT